MNVLFRCDGSREKGLGHVVRCLTLADELRRNHACNILFAMRISELGIRLVRKKYPVTVPGEGNFNYEDWLARSIESHQADLMILDVRDALDPIIVRRLKEKFRLFIVDIDDPEEKRLAADVVFYPPVPQVKQMNWTGFSGKVYCGFEYVILRKEFLGKYKVPHNKVPNILITMGASDPEDMTVFTLNALKAVNERFTVTIILGAGYPNRERIATLMKTAGFGYRLHHDPRDIAKIMAGSDMGIISFGQTAYEATALGIPVICLCLTEDHVASSEFLEHNGTGISLGLLSDLNPEKLIETVSGYLQSGHILKEMSGRAALLKKPDPGQISSLIITATQHG